jgi:hypothetical protein
MYLWIAVLGGVPSGVEHQQHLVLLDQLAHLLDRLGRAVAVVVGDEVDLAAVDAALGVDLLEVGADGLADGAVGRRRPAVGLGVADLDLLVVGAGVVLLLRQALPAAGREREERDGEENGWRFMVCLSPVELGVKPAVLAFPRKDGTAGGTPPASAPELAQRCPSRRWASGT